MKELEDNSKLSGYLGSILPSTELVRQSPKWKINPEDMVNSLGRILCPKELEYFWQTENSLKNSSYHRNIKETPPKHHCIQSNWKETHQEPKGS